MTALITNWLEIVAPLMASTTTGDRAGWPEKARKKPESSCSAFRLMPSFDSVIKTASISSPLTTTAPCKGPCAPFCSKNRTTRSSDRNAGGPSSETACKEGKIRKIRSVDHEIFMVLYGAYAEWKTVVTGD